MQQLDASGHAAMAAAAGIDRAWRDHRADVEEAIALAARFRGGFTRPTDPAAEPIPAYAVSRRPPRRISGKPGAKVTA